MATNDSTRANDGRRLNRVSLAVLVFVVALIGLSTAQVIYRVLLPTEGWNYSQGETTEDFQENTVVFTENLLGSPSPLRVGDRLIAVEGVRLDPFGSLTGPAIADHWHVDQTVRYTIRRDGQIVDLAVPLKHWTATSIVTHVLGDFNAVGGLISALLIFGLGLFVLLKRSEEPATRALLLLAVTFLANTISATFVPDGPTTQYSLVWPVASLLNYWIFGILIGPSLFVLSLTFPHPKRMLQRAPWLVVLPYTVFWVLVAIFGWAPEIGYGLTGGLFLLSLLSAIHSAFGQRDAVSRAQMRWGLGGFIGAIVLSVPAILLTVGVTSGSPYVWLLNIANIVSNLAFPVFTSCLTVAILRYRLFDIDIIIRRTLVYTLLTLTLGATYAIIVVILQALFRQLTGETSTLAVVASTLVIAALFQPARRRVQNLIDRRFYRKKYDAQRVLEAFAQRIQTEAELETLAGDMIGVVQETLQPEDVKLWLVRRS